MQRLHALLSWISKSPSDCRLIEFSLQDPGNTIDIDDLFSQRCMIR